MLDGLHRLSAGTLAVLLRLVDERELALFDGEQLVSPARHAALLARHAGDEAALARRRIGRVHPAFRLLCLAAPPRAAGSSSPAPGATGEWLTNELLQLFHFFSLDDPQGVAAAAPRDAERPPRALDAHGAVRELLHATVRLAAPCNLPYLLQPSR